MLDFKTTVGLEPRSKLGWNFLGLCHHAGGDYLQALECFDRVLALDTESPEALANAAQSCRELGLAPRSLQLYARALALDARQPDVAAQHGWLLYRAGAIGAAADAFHRCLALAPAHELGLHGAAAACVAQGAFSRAQPLYERVLAEQRGNRAAFYAAHIARRLSRDIHTQATRWSLSGRGGSDAFSPRFLDSLCRKMVASDELRAELAAAPNASAPLSVDHDATWVDHSADAPARVALLRLADAIGQRLAAFAPACAIASPRMQRASGLAAVEMTQLVARAVADGSGQFEDDCNAAPVGWRDLVDVFARWRLLADPNEPTVWLDAIDDESRRDGFALEVPLVHGHLKVHRTAPYFARTLELTKRLMPAQCGAASTADEQRALNAAASVARVHALAGGDFFVVAPLAPLRPGFASAADVGDVDEDALDGVRVTVMQLGGGGSGGDDAPATYLFSVSTPSTLERWARYDAILADIWGTLVATLQDAGGAPMAAADRAAFFEACALFYYFLVNFGPLSLGSAQAALACVAAFVAAAGGVLGAPTSAALQFEWEAYLAASPLAFVRACAAVGFPMAQSAAAVTNESAAAFAAAATSAIAAVAPAASVEGASAVTAADDATSAAPAAWPSVVEQLPTLKHAFEALAM